MIVVQHRFAAGEPLPPGDPDAQLVLAFGGRAALADGRVVAALRAAWPGALLAGCSTAGEILGQRVTDDTIVATAIRFDRSWVRGASATLSAGDSSHAVGLALAKQLPAPGLRHVFVLSDGLAINGSGLARGLEEAIPAGVRVTGGLAGDGERFERTLVIADGAARPYVVSAVGLYGESLHVGYGSLGGWDPFGPDRRITRSTGNVLHELDGQSALALYKRYLGPAAGGLPGSAMAFPLLLVGEGGNDLVRTVLAVDEDAGSITFAGDVPEGVYARFMHANMDRLVDGAQGAAQAGLDRLGSPTDLAILISCVGRRRVLGQRVEEELEAVAEVLGATVPLAGYYSYGELSPVVSGARCELHNQTMTITTIAER